MDPRRHRRCRPADAGHRPRILLRLRGQRRPQHQGRLPQRHRLHTDPDRQGDLPRHLGHRAQLQHRPHNSDYFKTESDGVLTGTEAAIKYRADNCSRAGKEVRFHWDNPYHGRNGYDFDGTDGAFTTRYTGGNGDNATVDAHVS
ncbi:aegerolysin family protein [Streptosporangium jomthongense]|uniref:Aegerolysin family protein n=1 Tax=Streptosporangium jomthongense TaxID=1193683 RepID=A0ABV8FBG6_9ACTN